MFLLCYLNIYIHIFSAMANPVISGFTAKYSLLRPETSGKIFACLESMDDLPLTVNIISNVLSNANVFSTARPSLRKTII